MHIDWTCKNNAADEDCNKCMIFGIVMDCPYNCPYRDKDYTEVEKDDIDKQGKSN